MFPGISLTTAEPMGTLPARYRLSTPALFDGIFNDPDAEIIFLVEAHPYAPARNRMLLGLPAPMGLLPQGTGTRFLVIDGEADIYLSAKSKGSYTTQPDDPTLPNTPFLPRLTNSFRVQAQLFAGLNITTGLTARGSEIEVVNEAPKKGEPGEFDAWAGYGWDGRVVEIKAGLAGFAYDDFGTIAKFNADTIVMNEDMITISLRDKSSDLDRYLQQNLYAGTGGKEGGADIAGSRKPLGFGMVRNALVKRVSAALLIFQLHDGKIESVVDVRDMGVSLGVGADYASYDLLAAAVPAGGTYATCLVEGFIKLGSIPSGNGQVTVDFEGDKTGGVYVSSAAKIARRIVTTRLGANNLQDPVDLNALSFANVEASNPAVIGLYIDGPENVRNVLTSIMASVYGFWYFERDGTLAVGLMRRAAAPVAVIDQSLLGNDGVERLPLGPSPWRVRVGYKRMWQVQGGTDLAGSLSGTPAQALYENEYRFAIADNSLIKTKHRLSDVFDWPTLLDVEADALALAAEILAMAGPDLRRYRFAAERSQLRYWLNDEITLQADMIDLKDGVSGLIVAIEENYDNGIVNLEMVG